MTEVPGFELQRLGDLAEVFDGPHATARKVEEGPWYLSISSLKNGRLDLAESAHIHVDDLPKWTRRVAPRQGDTLFSYETRLGEAAYWDRDDQAALGRRMGLLRPRPGRVHPRFLSYAYLSEQFQETIRKGTLYGVTVNRIPVGDLPDWKIAMPSLPEQERIAGVLGAFDDLIETNRTTMAQIETGLTLAWRRAMTAFPARDPLPFFDVFKITYGAPFAGAQFVPAGQGRPLIRIRDLKTGVPDTWTTEARVDETLIRPGETLVGMDAEFTPRYWMGAEGVLNQRVCKPTSNYGGPAFCREALVEPMAFVQGFKTGTTVAHLNKRDMETLTVKIPGDGGLAYFNDVAPGMHTAMVGLAAETADLTRQRDELLPLLMSGKVRVLPGGELS